MPRTYRSIYDAKRLRSDDTRPPKRNRDRIPKGGAWVRDDAGLPGADGRDGSLEADLKATISATRRMGGLVGGPSQGGVDMAIEQKLKQSAGGAAILDALTGAWLRRNAPHWDGTGLGPGRNKGATKYGHGGLGLQLVGDESSEKETPKEQQDKHQGSSQYSGLGNKGEKGDPRPHHDSWGEAAAGIDWAYTATVAATLLGGPAAGLAAYLWTKLPDFNQYYGQDAEDSDPGSPSLGFPDVDEASPSHSNYSGVWAGMSNEADARRTGEWVWVGADDDAGPAAAPGSQPGAALLASLLGMQPGEWVWSGVTASSGLEV